MRAPLAELEYLPNGQGIRIAKRIEADELPHAERVSFGYSVQRVPGRDSDLPRWRRLRGLAC